MKKKELIAVLYDALLSKRTRKKIEKIILYVAITSFLIHLAVIYIVQFLDHDTLTQSELLEGPISAIYTPMYL